MLPVSDARIMIYLAGDVPVLQRSVLSKVLSYISFAQHIVARLTTQSAESMTSNGSMTAAEATGRYLRRLDKV